MSDTRGSPSWASSRTAWTSYVKNLLFDNVNIVLQRRAEFHSTDSPVEYTGQYPENTIWTNLPAYGYYLRHATNVVFTNCFTGVSPADARPWMTNADMLGLKVFGPVLGQIANPGGLVLQWKYNFVLQSATNITGTYADVPGAPDPTPIARCRAAKILPVAAIRV